MLESTLLKSNYLGRDGFIWWLGQIAPASVWRNEKSRPDAGENKKPTASDDKTGNSWAWRCKVRIIGYHPFDRDVLPDAQLPWAHVMETGGQGSAQGGIGETMRIAGGETCFGFFMDGDDAQQPVIVGLIHRNESVKNELSENIKNQLRPFTGHSGPLRQSATQTRKRNDGVQGNPQTSSTPLTDVAKTATIGQNTTSSRDDSKPGADQLIREDLASQQFGDEGNICITRENGCNDNLIGKISKILQEFIQFVGRIQDFIGTYIDPVLNTFVDIVQEIRGFARRIVGVVKFIINNMRGAIIGLITKLFRDFISLVLPLPQHPPVAEATKNIINIIFCLFEKLIPLLIDYIVNLLSNMIGKTINSPMCAVEEFTAGILGKLMDFIDDLLGPVMSGLNWLLGGIGQVSSILGKVSSIAQQILNFIGCDQLKCETATDWCSKTGASKSSRDGWNRTLKKLNFMKGINDSIDEAMGYTSLFGYTGNSPFRECGERSRNPRTQKDKTPMPNGVKSSQCIPPEIEVFGDGVQAQVLPIVANDGSILTVQVLNGGKGFTKPPSINIIDNTNNGIGAEFGATIQNGTISAVYVKNPGQNYCPGDYSTVVLSPTYLVTADQYSVFEGDDILFTITTTNVPDGTTLEYELGGDINLDDLNYVSSLTGTVTINNGTATLPVGIKQDSIPEPVETMIFSLYDKDGDYVAKTTVLISNRLSPVLTPEPSNPVEAPPGTVVPDPVGGTIGVGTTSPVSNINPFPGINTSISGGGAGIGTNIVGIITGIAVGNPGFGYTSGDEIRFGDCVFPVIVTPTGAIVGVQSSTCSFKFDRLPEGEIITSTGEGASVFPIIQFVPQFTKVTVVNQLGVIRVIDCV